VPGILSPAIPGEQAGSLLALQFQLAQSQWWTPDVMADVHRAQLTVLLEHVWRQIPYYRERLAGIGWQPGQLLSSEQFRRIPILSREQAMRAGEALRAAALPEGHGKISSGTTSGSTGRALRYWNSEAFRLMQDAGNLRFYLWHRWDLVCDSGGILVDMERRAEAPDGKTFAHWGDWVSSIYPTGRYHLLSARSSLQQQLEWLQARRPAYLHIYPSNLEALLLAADRQQSDLSFIQRLCTLGETVKPALRAMVRERFDQPLLDVYSAHEVGYMAIQCPRHEHYHVQAESVVLEVLDQHDQPCAPGQVGRVVVTPLHNFAAPLLRYEIGDYAEVGEPCDCGRQLPVIRRILGRTRNMLRKPDGSVSWPHFGTKKMHERAPIEQFQVAQTAIDRIELRLVVKQRLSAELEAELIAILRDNLDYPFAIGIRYFDRLERSAGGKYEDFISLL